VRDIILGGFVIILLTVAPGLYLWWPKKDDDVARSDLGIALMTGALIAVAVLGIQTSIDGKARKRDERRQIADARQNFELTLSLKSDLSGIRLDGEDLRGIHFYGKIMRRASLNRAIMNGVVLSHAVLDSASLQHTHLPEAIMDDALLRQAHLEHADLTGAILSYAKMRGAKLADAHLESATLTHAYVWYADLRNAHLEGASFSDAKLHGTDMTGATWDSATGFEGALYDRFTKWPFGVKQRKCRRDEQCVAANPPS
jgi:uncharacterized protein YjbI with pentapeptide repeats